MFDCQNKKVAGRGRSARRPSVWLATCRRAPPPSSTATISSLDRALRRRRRRSQTSSTNCRQSIGTNLTTMQFTMMVCLRPLFCCRTMLQPRAQRQRAKRASADSHVWVMMRRAAPRCPPNTGHATVAQSKQLSSSSPLSSAWCCCARPPRHRRRQRQRLHCCFRYRQLCRLRRHHHHHHHHHRHRRPCFLRRLGRHHCCRPCRPSRLRRNRRRRP